MTRWLDLELSPIPGAPDIPCLDFELDLTESGFYPPLTGIPAYSGTPDPTSAPYVFYKSGGTPAYPRPNTDHVADNWSFPVFNVADGALPTGFGDTAWSDVNSLVQVYLFGPGTLTVHTGDSFGQPGEFHVALLHGNDVTNSYEDQEDLGVVLAGATGAFTVPEDGHCAHVLIFNMFGDVNVEYTVFGGVTWAGTYA